MLRFAEIERAIPLADRNAVCQGGDDERKRLFSQHLLTYCRWPLISAGVDERKGKPRPSGALRRVGRLYGEELRRRRCARHQLGAVCGGVCV